MRATSRLSSTGYCEAVNVGRAGRVDLLDDVDRLLIGELRDDGRRSFSEIGRRIGFSEPTIRQHYNRLVDLGVIYVVGMYDELKIGEIAAHVGVRVVDVALSRVATRLAEHPQVKYVACVLGYYDIFMYVVAADIQSMGDVVHALRRIRGVSEFEVLTVLDVVKDTYVWQGFREPFPA